MKKNRVRKEVIWMLSRMLAIKRAEIKKKKFIIIPKEENNKDESNKGLSIDDTPKD